MRVTALAGGVGAARFLEGLVQVVDPADITVVVNTGDDAVFHGLYVSPDVDIVLYTLAGIVDASQGWGIQGDSYATLGMLERLGRDTWFKLGDRDLATHILRTQLMREGWTHSRVTAELAARLRVRATVLPMTDQVVQSRVETPDGWLPFQEYFVKRRTADDVLDIALDGVAECLPAPGVLDAIETADVLIVCPSNPLVSIGTILSVPGVRPALVARERPVVAISPIVGGGTIKGPADRMMRAFGIEVSPVGVAEHYRDFLDVLVLDRQDATEARRVERLGIRAVAAQTIMRDGDAKRELARVTVEAANTA